MASIRSGLLAALLALLLTALAQAASPETLHPRTSCPLGLSSKGTTTILFVADPGAFSGTGEAAYYLSNLQGARQVSAGATACTNATVGRMMRQNIAVIVTGIGPLAAALCVFDVMNKCGPNIKDVFYSGTAGWSPQLGGVINNGSCSAANSNADIVRLGDVCVSPFSVNWDCRMASWDNSAAGFPNQCSFPMQQLGPSASDMFGQCQFTNVSRSQLAMADEVLAVAAAKANNMPVKNNVVQDLDAAYWRSMAAGTGLSYSPAAVAAPARVWGYKQCMEIDSQFFWSGAPWDMVARSYVADTLNVAFGGSSYSQGNVLAVSAMEGIGLSAAMERYNALSSSRGRRVPFTIVRGMSDFAVPPLQYNGAGVWAAKAAVEDFKPGYKYAISTTSAVVLSTLQARCERLPPMSPPSSAVNSCSFTINYN